MDDRSNIAYIVFMMDKKNVPDLNIRKGIDSKL